jgi:putative SOS response-associated peptidase YedK
MCGRYTIKFTLEEANRRFQVEEIRAKFTPSYNVAPSQNIPVIFDDNGKVTIDIFKWGLIPHWAKEPKIGYKMINARIETISEKRTYNKELIEGRCLIPASGFFEWKKVKEGKKPMYIHIKNQEIFAFAGISSNWKAPDGKTFKTCSIITTQPNAFMSKIHGRMPAILTKNIETKWISPDLNDKEEILKLIHPYSAKDIEAYEISTMVNSPSNNNPTILQPI